MTKQESHCFSCGSINKEVFSRIGALAKRAYLLAAANSHHTFP